jgi:catechol 2,3-dioxygenase-like lactoylglutathione lyase family enzyme
MTQPLRYAQLQVAVADLDAAAAAYRRVLRLAAGDSGRDDEEGARWIELGAAGEGAVRLMEPTGDGPLARAMEHRADERNPRGEGYYLSVWRTPEIEAVTAVLGASGAAIEEHSGGRLRPDPLAAHGVRFEIAPEQDDPREAPLDAPYALSHIGLAVRDRDRAIATFHRLLGTETVSELHRQPFGDLEWQRVGRGGRRMFTLLTPATPGSALVPRMDRRAGREHPEGEGVHVVVFGVPDLAAGAAAASAAGASVVRGDEGTYWIHPRSLHGLYVEVIVRGS